MGKTNIEIYKKEIVEKVVEVKNQKLLESIYFIIMYELKKET